MSTISRYWDKYKERHRGESAEKSDLSKLANDKQAYISFLEVQLERVTQTVLTTQGFSDRIESLQTQLNSSDEKIINLTRLVKLQQTFAETQEDEISSIKKIIGNGLDGKNLQIASAPTNFERRLKSLEEKLDSPKSERNRFEDFVKEIDAALKSTENRITGLVSHMTDEIEGKQQRFQKDIEETLEKYSQQFEENYEELSKKVYGRENESKKSFKKLSDYEIERPDKDSERSFAEKTSSLENAVKDLEQFLVAIAEEVKKIDERQKETAELEYKVSSKLNQKVKKLSDFVHRSLKSKQDPGKSPKTPETRQIIQNYHIKHENYSKESPKFPEVSPNHTHEGSRSRSKESNTSKERSKSPQDRIRTETKVKSTKSEVREPKEVQPRREKSKVTRASKISKDKKSPQSSKSPKSATSRSRKSNSSSRTPVSNSSSRTPKSRRSVSPNRTPGRSKEYLNETPKATTKSKAMEGCIREKIQKMKQKDLEERKIQMKKDEKRKTKKNVEKMSKLDKLYRDL